MVAIGEDAARGNCVFLLSPEDGIQKISTWGGPQRPEVFGGQNATEACHSMLYNKEVAGCAG